MERSSRAIPIEGPSSGYPRLRRPPVSGADLPKVLRLEGADTSQMGRPWVFSPTSARCLSRSANALIAAGRGFMRRQAAVPEIGSYC